MKFTEKLKSIVNCKFGRLQATGAYKTILKSNLKQTYKVQHVECVCDCGNKKYINVNSLINGLSLSCGCYSKEISKKNLAEYKKNNPISPKKLSNYDRLINIAFRSYKKRSILKNITFELTKLQFIELITKNCYYCNRMNDTILSNDSKFSEGFNGIDRKNNSLGYTESNCVTCCKTCNYFKSSYNENEFLSLIARIYENKENRQK